MFIYILTSATTVTEPVFKEFPLAAQRGVLKNSCSGFHKNSTDGTTADTSRTDRRVLHMKILYLFIRKKKMSMTNPVIPYTVIIAVCFTIRTKLRNSFCGQNVHR